MFYNIHNEAERVREMTEVFLYNIENSKSIKIKLLCRKLNIAVREVQKDEYGLKLSALLGLSDDQTVAGGADFDDEMLYLSEFYGAMLDIFLNQLKRQKTTVALKAVRTQTNVGFTSYELHSELSAEHAMMRGQKT